MTNNTLKQYAHTLRLSGLLSTLELRLKEAEASRLPYAQFLEIVFQDEINVREQRTIARRTKLPTSANCALWTTSTLLSTPPSIAPASTNWPPVTLSASSATRYLLARPGWAKAIWFKPSEFTLSRPASLCFTARCSISCELSAEATQAGESRLLGKYLKPDLLIIDDMGLKILPSKSGEILLEIIMRRYENRSTLMTSNRPIEEWGKLLSDVLPPAPSLTDCSTTPKSLR